LQVISKDFIFGCCVVVEFIRFEFRNSSAYIPEITRHWCSPGWLAHCKCLVCIQERSKVVSWKLQTNILNISLL
jgi:hypothetical protein